MAVSAVPTALAVLYISSCWTTLCRTCEVHTRCQPPLEVRQAQRRCVLVLWAPMWPWRPTSGDHGGCGCCIWQQTRWLISGRIPHDAGSQDYVWWSWRALPCDWLAFIQTAKGGQIQSWSRSPISQSSVRQHGLCLSLLPAPPGAQRAIGEHPEQAKPSGAHAHHGCQSAVRQLSPWKPQQWPHWQEDRAGDQGSSRRTWSSWRKAQMDFERTAVRRLPHQGGNQTAPCWSPEVWTHQAVLGSQLHRCQEEEACRQNCKQRWVFQTSGDCPRRDRAQRNDSHRNLCWTPWTNHLWGHHLWRDLGRPRHGCYSPSRAASWPWREHQQPCADCGHAGWPRPLRPVCGWLDDLDVSCTAALCPQACVACPMAATWCYGSTSGRFHLNRDVPPHRDHSRREVLLLGLCLGHSCDPSVADLRGWHLHHGLYAWMVDWPQPRFEVEAYPKRPSWSSPWRKDHWKPGTEGRGGRTCETSSATELAWWTNSGRPWGQALAATASMSRR